MKTEHLKNKGISITLRTALLSWLVTISTLLIFVGVIIPQQQRIFLENLESKAHSVAVSLHEVTASAAMNEDFSSVVDRCKEMLNGDQSLDYLVITKNDGFSLIYDRTGWRSETNSGSIWHPDERKPVGGIGVVPLFHRRLFHYSQPFDYSGIQWGWIHVGLSLDSYDRSVAAVYHHTGLLAIGCMILSLMASGFYAKRLVRPIVNLRNVVQKVSSGDLSARASIERRDELGSLANSVNTMTEALLRRDRILQSVRFAAQQFLSTSKWDEIINEVLARIGEAAAASRVCVFENHTGENGAALTSQRFVWNAAGDQPQGVNPALQDFSWSRSGLTHWADHLKHGECVSASSRDWMPPEKAVLESLGIFSVLLIPIRVENSWWGFLGLDECSIPREWTDAERDSLRAAADMLGAAISRQRTQDALLHAKEAAETANQSKSQFLANMSHEIRTPITGVIGMLQLLQRTPLDDKQRRYVSNTMTSADALLKVIGNVLDFSKIEAGKLELEERTFSVPDVLDAAVRLLAEKAEAKKLEVACWVASEVPQQLAGDPDRLRQVLLNLLSNAIKFTEHGTVVLFCSLAERANATVTLRFEVRDTGVGIAPQQQAVIFDAFCQADNSMSRTHGGTGLGLAICRQIVRMFEGQIGADSVPGEGSTFWFTARFKEAGQDLGVPSIVDFRGLRVLVVDDCAVVREIISNYVRTWKGLPDEASEATTGLEKLRHAAAQGMPFSVAVIDWQMPGLDGFALARQIKQEAALKAIGLVLISSFTQTNLATDCEAAGFAAWLPKPARKSELYDAIIRAANGRLQHIPKLPPAKPLPGVGSFESKGSGTILLAEDNEINQEVASEMLTAMGYRCRRVRTGREAVECIQNGLADLVLMDCQMPEMDGYEAARIIRRWEREETSERRGGQRLPIVALTAHAMKGDRARCLEAGMDDYLSKPLEPGELAKTLARWMPQPMASESSGVKAATSKTSGAGPSPAGIDFPSLLRRCMGKMDLAQRIIQKFRIQASTDVHELDAAIREQDALRLRQVAHRLKGSAANVSAEAVRECADRLEVLGRDGNLAAAAELLPKLRAGMEAVKDSTT